MHPGVIAVLLLVVGLLTAAVGAALLWTPAALVIAGGLLSAWGLFWVDVGKPKR